MKFVWKQVVVAFLLGVAVGGIGGRWCALEYGGKPWSRWSPQRLLQQFSRKLRLTPEQRTQVGAILEAKRQKIDALRAEARPRFDEIRSSASVEIRQLLTPEQQARYEKIKAEQQAHRERWRARRE